MLGLEIFEPEEFQNVKAGENYYVNLGKIGESIICFSNRGDLSDLDSKAQFQILDDFIEAYGIKKPFVEIRDLEHVSGRAGIDQLKYQRKIYGRNKKDYQAIIYCNYPKWMRGLTMAALLKTGFIPHVRLTDSRSQALAAAVQLHERKLERETYQYGDLIFDPYWEYRSSVSRFHMKCGIIPGKVLYASLKGNCDSDEILKAMRTYDRLYEKGGFSKQRVYHIIDLTSHEGRSFHHLRKYLNLLDSFNKRYSSSYAKIFILYGNRFKKIAHMCLSRFPSNRTVPVDSIEQAFNSISDPTYRIPLFQKKVCITEDEIARLNTALGKMLWLDRDDDAPEIAISSESPLKPVFETMNIVRENTLEINRINQSRTRDKTVVLESLQTAILIIDEATGRILFANKMAVNKAQVSLPSLMGKEYNFFFFCTIDGENVVAEDHLDHDMVERIMMRMDGSAWHAMKSVKSILFNDKPAKMISYVDIDDLQKARTQIETYNKAMEKNKALLLSMMEDTEILQKETMRANEQLSLIKEAINSSGDFIAISDMDGVFIYRNQNFIESFGSHINRIKDISVIGSDCDTAPLLRALDLSRKGMENTGEIQIYSQLNIHFFVSFRSALFLDDQQKPQGVIWNFTDIWEKKRAEKQILEYTETIEKDLLEKRSMLQKAFSLQQLLIQKSLPLVRDFNIRCLYMPCEKLGGDFFRIVKSQHDDKMIIIAGDCTDHGMKASMDASLLSRLADQHLDRLFEDMRTDIYLTKVSREFSRISDDDQYPTMTVMIIDFDSGEMFYSNANGELPLIHRGDDIYRLDKVSGFHLGYFEKPLYGRERFVLRDKDRILLYSDAVVEMEIDKWNRFGHEGLKGLVAECSGNASESFDIILGRLEEECKSFPLEDDTTLILLEYRERRSEHFRFSDLDQWKSHLNRLREELLSFDYSEGETEKICISVSEMCINAHTHGNKGVIGKSVEVKYSIDCRESEFLITDEGEGFDPYSVPDPISTLEALMEEDDEEVYSHGRGLWIARNYMDSLEYNRKGNQVRLMKKKEERKPLMI